MSKNSVHEETYRGCKIRLETDDSPSDPREDSNVGTMCCWHRLYTLGDEQPKCSPEDWMISMVQGGHHWENEKLRRQDAIRAAGLCSQSFDTDEEREAAEDELESSLDEVEGIMEEDRNLVLDLFEKGHVILPLFLYDHSGLSISTGAFSCRWDSGQVGFIYCTLEKAQHEWGTADSKAKGWDGEASYSLKEDGTKHTLREAAEDYLKNEVKTYNDYLSGDVAGWIAEDPDGEQIDSSWGYYPDEGDYSKRWDYPIGEAKSAIDYWLKEQEKEKAEAAYWACRDSMTV